MTAPLSIVIPTLNAAGEIGPCLGALAEALTEGLIREVILTDGGSSDGIGKITRSSWIAVPRGSLSAWRGGALRRGSSSSDKSLSASPG